MLHCIQDGVKETGVSIVFTVRKLDAGPVIASEKVAVDDDIKVQMLACNSCPLLLFILRSLTKTYQV